MFADIKKLLTRQNLPQLIVAVVGVLYILGDINPPHEIAGLVTTPLGVVVLIASVLALGRLAHPVVAVIYLIAAYELFQRSRKTHVRGPERKLPVDKRDPQLTAENQFPVTLEEQVVKKMAPWVLHPSKTAPSYKPVLDDDMNASEL
jgi:hypothetical protein